MKQIGTTTLARLNSSFRPVVGDTSIRKITQLSRLSSVMEPLESRTMMSAGLLLPTPAPLSAVHPVATKVVAHATQNLIARSNAKASPVAKIAPAKPVVSAAPHAPTGLVATGLSRSQIKLGWTVGDSTVSGYYVLRSSDGARFTQVSKLTGAAIKTFTDSGLTSGQAYKYQVQAYRGSATSAASTVATGVTLLSAPSGVAVTATSSSALHLTWTNIDSSATGCLVLRSTDGVNFQQIMKLTTTGANSFDDQAGTSFTKYYYEILATTLAATSPASAVVSATTALAAPTGVSTTATGSTSARISWVDTDPAAMGYAIYRSTNGSAFTAVQSIGSGKTFTWTDSGLASARNYTYQVKAVHGSTMSAASGNSAVTTTLNAPSALTVTLSNGDVVLSWTANDSSTTAYTVARSTDGLPFTTLTTISGASTSHYTDSTTASGHGYSYQITARAGDVISQGSNIAGVVTPLVAPAGLAVSGTTGAAVLTWTDRDSSATGYNISRSSDGNTFVVFAKLSGSDVSTYTDSTVSSAHTYYYQVQAFNAVSTSPTTASAPVTMPGLLPANSTVVITTRYGNELVVTATGNSDAVSITQSGSLLTIVANGQAQTQPAPAAGLFIYTRGGTDTISIDQSVAVQTTIEAIDNAADTISSSASRVSVWDDSSDIFTGTGSVHGISTFAGGVSKASGASLKDPTDSGAVAHASASLWGTGPVAGDVNQGNSGDCYFLSSLAAFAGVNPARLQQSAVDMGDGTYTVQYTSNGSAQYLRVSNDLPVHSNGVNVYARPGASGSIWATIMEKAYAFFRSGANTYASISSGWMGELYSALGVQSTFFYTNSLTSDGAMYTKLSADLASGKAVTFGTPGNAPKLVSGHAYTLVSVSKDSSGTARYVVRNPWGISGDSLEDSQGYATLSFAQMEANFQDACEALS